MFIESKDWKKRGIKDEDMETVDYIGDKDSSKEDRDALKNSSQNCTPTLRHVIFKARTGL